MCPEERRQAIAQLVGQRGRVSVAAAAGRLDVTTGTVRRDPAALQAVGIEVVVA